MRILKDFRGRDLRLTDERMEHILAHPEMAGIEDSIGETLAHPQMVIESLSDDKVRLFYRELKETRVGVKWLCVVAKFKDNDAFVLTAYLTDKPKGGKRIWPAK